MGAPINVNGTLINPQTMISPTTLALTIEETLSQNSFDESTLKGQLLTIAFALNEAGYDASDLIANIRSIKSNSYEISILISEIPITSYRRALKEMAKATFTHEFVRFYSGESASKYVRDMTGNTNKTSTSDLSLRAHANQLNTEAAKILEKLDKNDSNINANAFDININTFDINQMPKLILDTLEISIGPRIKFLKTKATKAKQLTEKEARLLNHLILIHFQLEAINNSLFKENPNTSTLTDRIDFILNSYALKYIADKKDMYEPVKQLLTQLELLKKRVQSLGEEMAKLHISPTPPATPRPYRSTYLIEPNITPEPTKHNSMEFFVPNSSGYHTHHRASFDNSTRILLGAEQTSSDEY